MEELESYRKSWADLLDKDGNTNPFIEVEWFFSWLTLWKKADSFEIYVVKHNKEVVAFFPFVHTVQFGIHKFALIESDYMDIISYKQWREAAITYLFDELIKSYRRVIFQLNDLLESKETSQMIESYAIKDRLPYSIFRIVEPKIELAATELPDYKTKVRKKTANINRRERKLESLGQVSYEELFVENLDEVFEIYDKRWKKRIESSGFTDVANRDFFKHLIKQTSKAFHVELNSVKFEDNIIGFSFFLCCRGRKVCYRIGHDPDYHLFGPGSLLIYKDLKKSQSTNFEIIDFCNGYEPYKMEWSTHLDFTRHYIMSTRGKSERTLRLLLSILYSVKYKISASHRYVEFKRDTLGELRYLLKQGSVKKFVEKFKKMVQDRVYMRTLDIYQLERTHQHYTKSPYRNVPFRKLSSNANLSTLIPYYFQGYKLFSNEEREIVFKSHDRFIRDESVDLLEELPENSTYITDYDMNDLPEIAKDNAIQNLTLWTTINAYAWRKKRTLTALGFTPVERISKYYFFGLEKNIRRPK